MKTKKTLRRMNFEIVIPPVEPGQSEIRKTISVEVRNESGVEIITAESSWNIERIKMQMMISRLYDAVQKLNGFKPQPHTIPTHVNTPN